MSKKRHDRGDRTMANAARAGIARDETPGQPSELDGNEMAALEEEDLDGDEVEDPTAIKTARQELAELFRGNEWVMYETLDPIQRSIADGWMASRAVTMTRDKNGFLLVKPVSGAIRFLRGEDGADSILSGLAPGSIPARR